MSRLSVKRLLRRLLLVLVAALAVGLALAPRLADRSLNRVQGSVPPASERAKGLLARQAVVDLHADSLLWQRDLLVRIDHGQVDVPRLREGGVALQVFGLVTQTPAGLNYVRNRSDAFDMLTPLVVLQGWPPETWTSRRQRAVHQAEQLAETAARSGGALTVIETRKQLEALLVARHAGSQGVGGLLGIEGAQALDGKLESVDVLFAAGVRMIGLAHFFDNPIAGSSAGEEKHGLTPLGKQVVARMQELGIAVDLAHVSPQSVDDVLAMTTKPVVVSHTGVQATCPGPRNLSDAQLRGIAATGGVVGIGYWAGAVCGTSPVAIAQAMRHVRDLVGAPHVALGSDFDGSIVAAFDTTGLASLVDALLAEGFRESELGPVLGGNALRVLRETLP